MVDEGNAGLKKRDKALVASSHAAHCQQGDWTQRPLVGRPDLLVAAEDMPAKFGVLPSLDGLRALSITLVLLGHFVLPRWVAGISAFGVVLFFFISGFLITRLLFAEFRRFHQTNLGLFFIRRITRLYPVLVVYLAISLLVMYARAESVPPIEIVAALFYFTNYLFAWLETHGVPLRLPIGTLWSLAVEEHFYILMPCIAVLVRMRPRPLIMVSLSICLLCLMFRLGEWLNWPELRETRVIYMHSETRFDAIAVGVLMAALCETIGGRRLLLRLASPGWFAAGLSVLLLSFAVRQGFFQQTFRFSIQEFALYPVFCGILFGRLRGLQLLLNQAMIRFIGRLSYSLYIWGGGAKFLLGGAIAVIPSGLVPLTLLLFILAMAMASYHLVEMPIIRWRNRALRRDERAVWSRTTQADASTLTLSGRRTWP